MDIFRLFSGLRENPEIAFNEDFYNDLLNKKDDFEKLYPKEQVTSIKYYVSGCNLEELALL